MTTASGSLIKDFKPLSPNTSIYKAIGKRDSSSTDQPGLIVLCSWGWALRRYIEKYTAGYQALFPASDILLVESEKADFVWRTRASQRKRLTKAVGVINAALSGCNLDAPSASSSPVLLVAMSDGGCNSGMNLAVLLQQALHIQAMPIRALVLDSCPNVPHYSRAHSGFTQNLPTNPVVHFLGSVLVHVWLLLLVLFGIMGSHSQFNVNYDAINSDCFIASAVPRTYIFSKADKLTGSENVYNHAGLAEAAGYSVKLVEFKRSAHCAHLMEDREKYWDAVQEVWQRGRIQTEAVK